ELSDQQSTVHPRWLRPDCPAHRGRRDLRRPRFAEAVRPVRWLRSGGHRAMDGKYRSDTGLPDGDIGWRYRILRRSGTDHRPAGATCGAGSGLSFAGGDLLGAHRQRSVHGQQRLRVRPGLAGRQYRGADRRRRQTLGGSRHRRL
ncbi:Membrane protein, distant similarity to thiosulphate:quinone oxidoreductase DoxD, partial [Pseudomonas fluorescens]